MKNMKRHLLLTATLMLISPLLGFGQSDNAGDEQSNVRRVVENYLSKKDPEAVKRAFSADAKIISVNAKSGKLTETLISKPFKQPAGSSSISPGQTIAAIDVTEDGASVKVESEFPADKTPAVSPRKHVQYISLLKISGEWKIVGILMPPLKFAETASKRTTDENEH